MNVHILPKITNAQVTVTVLEYDELLSVGDRLLKYPTIDHTIFIRYMTASFRTL